MTTFADIVADAQTEARVEQERTSQAWHADYLAGYISAAILADPRFVDLLAGALLSALGPTSPTSQDAPALLAAAIVRSLGRAK